MTCSRWTPAIWSPPTLGVPGRRAGGLRVRVDRRASAAKYHAGAGRRAAGRPLVDGLRRHRGRGRRGGGGRRPPATRPRSGRLGRLVAEVHEAAHSAAARDGRARARGPDHRRRVLRDRAADRRAPRPAAPRDAAERPDAGLRDDPRGAADPRHGARSRSAGFASRSPGCCCASCAAAEARRRDDGAGHRQDRHDDREPPERRPRRGRPGPARRCRARRARRGRDAGPGGPRARRGRQSGGPDGGCAALPLRPAP